MKIAVTIFLCLAACNVFAQGNINSGKNHDYHFAMVAHGLSASKIPITHKKDSSAWGDGPYQFFKVIKTTDSVPATLNTVFGIEYRLTGTATAEVSYTTEWIYPYPLKESDGKKYKSYKTNGNITINEKSDENNSFSYTLSKANELLKGPWILNVYIEGKLLFTKKFMMY